MDNQQEMMFKLQMFEQQMQQIQQQMQAVERAIVEMNSLNFGLGDLIGKGPSKMGDDLEKSSEGKEILAPIGRGIFTKAKLISEELIVDIGGKNFVTKSIPQTKELIQGQIKKLNEVQRELGENLEQIGGEFNNMIMEAQKGEERK